MNTPHQELLDDFTEYVRQHQRDFYRLAYGYLHEQEAALDAVQEALEKALRGLSKLREPQYMRTWFYRILVNECLTALRKRKRELLPFTPEQLENLAEEPLANRAQILDLYAALDRLEPRLKTVVFLRFFEDMKFADIAQVTATNLNTVKSRMTAALGKLRISIEEDSL